MAGGGRTFSSMSRRTGRCRSTGRKLFLLCGGRGVEGTLMYGGGGGRYHCLFQAGGIGNDPEWSIAQMNGLLTQYGLPTGSPLSINE